MCGAEVRNLQCVALTDNQGLFSNIHYLKANSEDYRLHADLIELRQNIEQEKTVQEVRYVHSSLNLADCLTKTTKTGLMLLQVVRTGSYDLPGGTRIRDSTMTAVRTWNELMRVEADEETGPGGDKTDQGVYLVSVQPDDHALQPDDPALQPDDNDHDEPAENLQQPGGSPPPPASVSHPYDGPVQQGLVLLSATEASSQVSQQSYPETLANPDSFHGNHRGVLETRPLTNINISQKSNRSREDDNKNFSLDSDNLNCGAMIACNGAAAAP